MIRALFTLLSLTAISTTTFARQSEESLQYICKEITENSWDVKQTLIITQLGSGELKEGVKYAFKLQVFEHSVRKPVVATKVTVQTEDVMFGFESEDKRVSGMIYLDELDQTSLTVDGVSKSFDCN